MLPVLLGALVALVLALVCAGWARDRRRWERTVEFLIAERASERLAREAVAHPLDVRRRVLVSLRTGRALDGVLWDRTDGWLVLRGARLLEPGSDPVEVDGEATVDAAQVEWVQLLAAEGEG